MFNISCYTHVSVHRRRNNFLIGGGGGGGNFSESSHPQNKLLVH